MKTTRWGLAGALVLALLTIPPAQGAPAPVIPGKNTVLQQVPASAPLVLYLHGLDRTIDRFLAMLTNINADAANQARTFLNMVKNGGFDGQRKFRGMSKDGPIFLAFMEMPNLRGAEAPKMAFIVRTTSYTEFRDNLLDEDARKSLKKEEGYESAFIHSNLICFVSRNDYTVVTPHKAVAEQFTKKFTGMDQRISDTQARKLLDGDLGLYLSMDAFGKDYADQIKVARKTVEEGLQAAEKALDRVANSGLEMVRQLVNPVFQAVEESQGVLLTIEFRPTGLALHLQSEARKGSRTSVTMKEFQTLSFAEIAALPEGQLTYSGWYAGPSVFTGAGAWLAGVPHRKDGAAAKVRATALADLLKAGPQARVDGFNPLAEGVQSWSFTDPGKAVEAKWKLLESLDQGDGYHLAILKEKPVLKKAVQKLQGFTFHSMQVRWDLEQVVTQLGQAMDLPGQQQKAVVEALKKVVGEEMTVWFGTDGKRVLQVTARNWETAQRLLEAHLHGKCTLEKQTAYQTIRKELPQRATILLLLDLPRYANLAASLVVPQGQGQPPMDTKPAYGGLALGLQSERITLDAFLTVEAMREVGQRWLGIR